MSKTVIAGKVTSYGAAVRGGYTGTYEQWCQDMANLGNAVAEVREEKTAAIAAVGAARSGAVEAVGQKSTEEQAAIDAEGQRVLATIPADYTELSGDVSDLKSAKAPVIIDNASGAIASFEDGADGLPIHKLTVNIEPVQDLHGYDRPWPAGGGKNLFDKNAVTTGKYINSDGTEAYSSAWDISDYIPVGSATNITKSGAASAGSSPCYAFYDSNKIYLSGSAGRLINSGSQTIAVPTGASYFRTSVAANEIGTLMVELGSTATDYEPYFNICPITGWTGCNVTRAGKNLLNPDAIAEINSTAENRRNGILFSTPGTYTVSGIAQNGTSIYARVKSGDTYGALTQIVNNATINTATYTINNNESIIVFDASASQTVAQSKEKFLGAKIQIELSVATDYEPYQGNIYPITFPASAGTVYGGTLTINADRTGELTVEWAEIDIKDLEISYQSNYQRFLLKGISDYVTTPSSASEVGAIKCECFKESAALHMQSNTIGILTSGNIAIIAPSYTTVSDFTNAFGDYKILYQLAVPIPYTLTPSQITTLLGTNNIWADCGPVSVDYPADTKLYIQKINAPTDDDMIADARIESGKYFLIGNTLYLSTTIILAGETIIPGTNCTKTNLAAALNALNT